MPTAYLSPSLLRELTDVSVSNPGAGEAGRLLTWNGTAFVLRTSSESRTDLGLGTLATQNANAVAITGGAISGITPLPLASGGTNSNDGSITGSGALTFAAGGTNQNITLQPSGTGNVTVTSTTQSTSATNGALTIAGGVGIKRNLTLEGSLVHRSASTIGYLFQSLGPAGGNNALGIALHSGPTSNTDYLWMSNNGTSGGWGGPDNYCLFASSTNDASFPTKSIWIAAHDNLGHPVPGILVQANTNRVGIARSNPTYTLDVNGSLRASGVAINFANLPTSNTGLAVGDLWRDGEIVKVKL